MARRTQGQGLISNRQKTWLWIVVTTAIVVALLYWEQIALLYVLATVAVTVLLLVVAAADLRGARNVVTVATARIEPVPASEITSNVVKPALQSTFGARPRKRRR